MKCTDCPYYWIEQGEKVAHCHYEWDDGYAPCEVDETEYLNEEEQ